MGYLTLTPAGVAFTDLPLTDVGAAAFQLEHDWFMRQDFHIRTAAGGGGSELVEGTDFTLSQEDTYLSGLATAAAGSGRNVFGFVAVINVAYQTGTLYFSGKYVADSNAPEDIEYRRVVAVSGADKTIRDDDGIGVLEMDPDGADRTALLPTAADNEHRRLVVVNTADADTLYKVSVDGEGAEVIRNAGRDFAVVDLLPGMLVHLKCDGTKWIKTSPPAWWKIPAPGTGWPHTKTSGWTVDRFTAATGGMEADYSADVPRGSLAVLVSCILSTDTGTICARAAGDPNISNTPVASSETHTYLHNTIGRFRAKLRLSIDYKLEIAVSVATMDVDLSHPSEVLW